MAEEAAQLAAWKAYEETLRAEHEAQVVGLGSLPEQATAYGLPMEEQARALLFEAFPPLNENIDDAGITRSREQQQQQMNDILHELMGIPYAGGFADESTAQLLRIWEQQRQQNVAAAAIEGAMLMRPQKHYFTISHDGTF